MKTFLNIIWHIPFLGFLFALSYAIVGLIFCATIVGLPIGLGLLQFSKFLLWPHGNKMVNKADVHELKNTEQNGLWKIFALIVRILYFPFGLLAAIGCIFTIVGEFVSIIGIPSGLVWAKSLGTIFNPVNKVCVPEYVALEIEKKKQERYLRNNGMVNSSTIANADAVNRINSIPGNTTPPPIPTSVSQPSIPQAPPLAQIMASVAANASENNKIVAPVPEEEITVVEEIANETIAEVVEVKIIEPIVETVAIQDETTDVIEERIDTNEIIDESVRSEIDEPEHKQIMNNEEKEETKSPSSFGYVEIETNEEVVYGGVTEETADEDNSFVVVEEFVPLTTTVIEEGVDALSADTAPLPESSTAEVPPVVNNIVEQAVKNEEPIAPEKPEVPKYRQSGYTSPSYSTYAKEEAPQEKTATESSYSSATNESATKKKSKMPIFIIVGVVLIAGLSYVLLSGGSEDVEQPANMETVTEVAEVATDYEEPLVKQDDEAAEEDEVIDVEVAEPAPIEPAPTAPKPQGGEVVPAREPVKPAEPAARPEVSEPAATQPTAHPAYGTKNYPSGTVYTGDFSPNGLRHGKGSYVWPSGDKYVGDWINDNATGTGIYYSHEGWRFEGPFLNLKFHGQGVYYFANGKSRKGTWVNGVLQK